MAPRSFGILPALLFISLSAVDYPILWYSSVCLILVYLMLAGWQNRSGPVHGKPLGAGIGESALPALPAFAFSSSFFWGLAPDFQQQARASERPGPDTDTVADTEPCSDRLVYVLYVCSPSLYISTVLWSSAPGVRTRQHTAGIDGASQPASR